MRDPNEIKGLDRERWLRSTMASLKKLTESSDRGKENKFPDATEKQTGAAVSRQIKSSSKLNKPAENEKQAALPERDSLHVALDFSDKPVARGVDEASRFSKKLEKQLRQVINRSTNRQEVLKNIIEHADSGGRLTARDTMRAIKASKRSGHINTREARKLRRDLGI